MKVFKRIKKVMVATLIAAMTLGAVTGCSSSSLPVKCPAGMIC